MATLLKVKTLAKKVGATVVDEKIGEYHTCSVEAPAGLVWSCDQLHELIDSTTRPWKPDYEDLLGRMSQGTELCANPECEWCTIDIAGDLGVLNVNNLLD
jgi:hypothetical protein